MTFLAKTLLSDQLFFYLWPCCFSSPGSAGGGTGPYRPPVSAVLPHFQNVVKPSFHILAPDANRPAAASSPARSFPTRKRCFSSASQVKQTSALILRPAPPPLRSRAVTIGPARLPRGMTSSHTAPFIRLRGPVEAAVPALRRPRWPRSHCSSVASGLH